ncbi:MAG: cyclase family protein [Planctomycetota bacterium]
MIYDLSSAIDDTLAVWPGDEAPRREVKCHLKDGAPVTLSALHTTLHAGTHADGPNHYGVDAPGIDQTPVDRFIGPCRVVSVTTDRARRYTAEDLSVHPQEIDGDATPRVLLKTGTYPDRTHFNTDFAALDPALVDALADRGVFLVGVDTPSVDLCDSKDLPSHKRFLARDVSILEGLILKDVPDGVYELIAPPLKIAMGDGSPVRALLRTLD